MSATHPYSYKSHNTTIVDDPEDFPMARERLPDLSHDELANMATDIREFLIDHVSATGGHLGPNLGVVELSLALHREFNSPHDRILFDIGHQSYVHKILTGRSADFPDLRCKNGLSGYPAQTESVHDVIENSHASTALSYADGIAKAWQLQGQTDRRVVTVIGDGALTGGLAWEGLNNLGAGPDRPVIVVLNDNTRSYSPSIGGLPRRLAELRRQPASVASNKSNVFTELGLAYLGPVDGHDTVAVETALRAARTSGRPTLVHCVTSKGKGYPPAEADDVDLMHTVGVLDPNTGRPAKDSKPTWTDAFSDEITALAEQRDDVVAVTAAMPHPVGLGRFAERFPERVFDVGIAEQHALTSAAGLALSGMHPVVALYATFLNRAVDQLLLDIALHRLPVTITLDRAGITGPDGASHHGMWDHTLLAAVPGLQLAAPRDATRLRELLHEAINTSSGPTCVRFPKASLDADLPAQERTDGLDILHRTKHADILLVAMGSTAALCQQAAHQLERDGLGCTVVDPRWIAPSSRALVDLAATHRLVLTAEDSSRTGGAGAMLAQSLTDTGCTTPVHNLGLPRRFLSQGSRQELLEAHGYTPQAITHAVEQALDGKGPYQHHPDRATHHTLWQP